MWMAALWALGLRTSQRPAVLSGTAQTTSLDLSLNKKRLALLATMTLSRTTIPHLYPQRTLAAVTLTYLASTPIRPRCQHGRAPATNPTMACPPFRTPSSVGGSRRLLSTGYHRTPAPSRGHRTRTGTIYRPARVTRGYRVQSRDTMTVQTPLVWQRWFFPPRTFLWITVWQTLTGPNTIRGLSCTWRQRTIRHRGRVILKGGGSLCQMFSHQSLPEADQNQVPYLINAVYTICVTFSSFSYMFALI